MIKISLKKLTHQLRHHDHKGLREQKFDEVHIHTTKNY